MVKPDNNWTLFLDRDGVINIEKENDYIHTWDEFVFYHDALDAIQKFAKLFRRIIIVTNQKGVGKGLTKEEDLAVIHQKMTNAIETAGGRIDAIFYCTDINDDSPCRKPNAGMALQAQQHFPDINFSHSVIVGNNISDMEFGRNAGMHTVFLRTTQPGLVLPPALADMAVNSLASLAEIWTH